MMDVERRSPPQEIRQHSSLSSSEIRPPSRESRCKSNFSKHYCPRGAGMSTCEIIAAFESGDSDPGYITTVDLTFFCRVCTDQVHKTSNGRQITSLERFVTRNKLFLEWSTRKQRDYSLNTVNIDEGRGGGSYSRASRGGIFSG